MRGLVYGMRGRKRPATLTALGLADLMFDSDYNPAGPRRHPGRRCGRRSTTTTRRRCCGWPRPPRTCPRSPAPRTFSAARYAAVCEETPLPWPRGAPFGERAARAQAEADRLGRARSSRSATRRRARTRSTSACAGRRRRPRRCWAAPIPPVPALILQGGDDLRTPPAGSARVAAALPGAQRVVLPGVGPRGDGRRPVALRRAAAVRVPARAQRGGAVQARADARAGHRRAAACRWVSWRRRPACPGVRGRTVAALDVTLDDLTFALSPALGSPLAGPGLRGGTFRLRRGAIALRRLRAVPGVRVSGRLPRRGSASLRISGPRRQPGRCGSPRAASVRGRLGGGRVRARLKAGPPRPVATAVRSHPRSSPPVASRRIACANLSRVVTIPAQSGLFFRPTRS